MHSPFHNANTDTRNDTKICSPAQTLTLQMVKVVVPQLVQVVQVVQLVQAALVVNKTLLLTTLETLENRTQLWEHLYFHTIAYI